MPTRREVLDIIEAGGTYEEAGGALGIDAGLAYMIATGLPADGSDTLTSRDRARPGFVTESTQRLANPEIAENPTRKNQVQAWITQRVERDAPMRTAAAKHGSVPARPPDPDDERDVITVLTRDHNYVSTLMKELETIPTASKGASHAQIERRGAIVAAMIDTLSLHEAVEETYFWPAVRELTTGGATRADEALTQEQRANELGQSLRSADPETEHFEQLTQELEVAIRRHVTFEEQVFLFLEHEMDVTARRALGERIHAAEARDSHDDKSEEA